MHADRALIKRCQKQDKRAFFTLFKQYESYIYQICYSYTQNEADALNIARAVYIQVIQTIDGLDNKIPFHPWLREIIVRKCLSHETVRKSILSSLYSTLEDEKKLEKAVSVNQDIEAYPESEDIKEAIKKHMGQLTERQRMTIILRYYEGLEDDKIALLMKVPVATVKNDLFRVRNILKIKIAEALF